MVITPDFQSGDESSILSICSQTRLLLIHRATYCDHRIKKCWLQTPSREVHLNKTTTGKVSTRETASTNDGKRYQSNTSTR